VPERAGGEAKKDREKWAEALKRRMKALAAKTEPTGGKE
jgi:hypothetical protein